ncbi:hypothetical protein Gasu2_00220 [Galdieria sulphuraria]|uniref:Uncharacterized protein n=1 Tax=Galdieria sulphuraria TaxID=130081 RepID=M2XSP2_GALSU|nr:uncharacterized protein Gasu_56990 [Galdieria sulphuraria]EME26693.1 hypothetical protein Gasu_56990 [Galdieria sulphuraria]GJD05559.1 hypothetical protein Gasu2_00220 [Galdieria sulphuraria]|eukprot:XP_005703213.1 hypothetical protein Gasu_56990 [Galdieria sulphuraria]
MSFNKLLKTLADRYASQAVPTKTVQGWETTSDLRKKLVATHINALPSRLQSAKEELKDFVQKTRTLDFTYLAAFRFGIRSLELAAWYWIGKTLGKRELPNSI